MLGKKFIFLILLFPLLMVGQENAVYHKEFYNNNKVKAEGWLKDGVKVKYWKFYSPYGQLRSEGHYKNGLKTAYWFYYRANGKKLKEGSYDKDVMTSWWALYNHNGELTERCQYQNGNKDGYRVVYVNEKPKRVEKFKSDIKTDQWTSYTGFIIDNGELLLNE